MSATNTRCPQCGTENRVGAKFCAHCGATQNRAAPPASPTPTPTVKKSSALPLVLIGIGVCLLLTCLSAAGVGVFALPALLATATPTPTNTPTFTPTFTPTWTPTLTLTPTPRPTSTATPTLSPTRALTATPVAKACPANPANVSVVNLLSTNLAISLSGPQPYQLNVPANTTVNVCLVAGNYSYTTTATGFNPMTGNRAFDAGEPQCWWWFGTSSNATRPPCNAPTDPRVYLSP